MTKGGEKMSLEGRVLAGLCNKPAGVCSIAKAGCHKCIYRDEIVGKVLRKLCSVYSVSQDFLRCVNIAISSETDDEIGDLIPCGR